MKVDGWAQGPVWTGAENLAPTDIRSPDRPPHSELLYRLSCPGPFVVGVLLYIECDMQLSEVMCFWQFEVWGWHGLYLKIQFVPRSKHDVLIMKTYQLLLYREIIAVCSEIHWKHNGDDYTKYPKA
jgi:hypothetical protein